MTGSRPSFLAEDAGRAARGGDAVLRARLCEHSSWGAGAVWVATDAGVVVRVERHLGVTARIHVGTDPTGVAVGEGAVWVADGRDGSVSRIDPAKNELVARIRVGNRPQDLVVVDGVVWVTVRNR